MTDTDQGSGLFADLLAKIDITVGSVNKLADQTKKLLERPAPAPVFYRNAQVVNIAANGIGILRFGGPDQGHFWYVRQLTIGGLSPTVVAAGRADVFVSAFDLRSTTNLAQLGLGDWRDQSAALPNIATYSRGLLPLRLNEELFVIFSGATVGQQYVGAIQVEDFAEAAFKQDFAV